MSQVNQHYVISFRTTFEILLGCYFFAFQGWGLGVFTEKWWSDTKSGQEFLIILIGVIFIFLWQSFSLWNILRPKRSI